MCGIIGAFNSKDAERIVKSGLEAMQTRNVRGQRVHTLGNNCLGHCDHSICSFANHPNINDGLVASNCKIFNWKELNRKCHIRTRNDADLILKLIELKGGNEIGIERGSKKQNEGECGEGLQNPEKIIEAIEELDGSFAFCYWKNDRMILARDMLGIKPLWYKHSDGLYFASERKALCKEGRFTEQESAEIIELDPRKLLAYSIFLGEFFLAIF